MDAFYRPLREDIFAYCRALNHHPSDQQASLYRAAMDATYGRGPRDVSCKSGQGPGKSAASVVVGTWRALRHLDARTVVTAPTMRQCKEWLTRANEVLLGAETNLRRFLKVTRSRVVIGGRYDWGVQLFTATKAEQAQGIHNEHLTAIKEEASGIKRELCVQIEGTLTNEDYLSLEIGNPNSRDCAFFDSFNSDRARRVCLTWNAEKSPFVSKEHNRRLEEKYGRDSDVYRVRVLGEFPFSDPRCVMSSEDVDACFDVSLYKACVVSRGDPPEVARQFGIDFARYGDAESVICRRHGDALVALEHFAHVDPNRVAERAFVLQSQALWSNEQTWYVPDAGGMGQGVMARFHDANKQVYEFQFGRKIRHPDFADEQTLAWFTLARKVKRRRVRLLRDQLLAQQLSTRQYFIDKNGKINLESKDDFEKRGFESPDRADAAVMAFFDGVVVGARMLGRDVSRKIGAPSIGRRS